MRLRFLEPTLAEQRHAVRQLPLGVLRPVVDDVLGHPLGAFVDLIAAVGDRPRAGSREEQLRQRESIFRGPTRTNFALTSSENRLPLSYVVPVPPPPRSPPTADTSGARPPLPSRSAGCWTTAPGSAENQAPSSAIGHRLTIATSVAIASDAEQRRTAAAPSLHDAAGSHPYWNTSGRGQNASRT